MKLYVDRFGLSSGKIGKDKTILSIADLHINRILNPDILKIIVDYIKTYSNEIDLVVIPGDIMNSWNFLDKNCMKKLLYFVRSIAEVTDVVISLGNHDVFRMTKGEMNRFMQLNKFPHIYALYNEYVELEGMRVIGFSPSHKTYNDHIAYIREFKKMNPSFDESQYTLLLNHDPLQITDPFVIKNMKEELKYIDLILAGHLHNGYVPKIIESIFKESIKDKGIQESPKSIFRITKYCRGKHNINGSNLIVTKGVRPYASFIPGFIKTSPNITEINIKKRVN